MDAKDIAEELQDLVVEHADSQESPDSPPEKMLTASQVNELVKRAKRKGEQKMQEQLDATRQELEQLKAQQAQQQEPQQQQQAAPQGFDPVQLQQLVAQQITQQQEEQMRKQHEAQLQQEVNQVAQQYFGKMDQGRTLYDDFEAVTADFNPAEFPQLVYLANELDNTAAVIYELRKNPGKLASIEAMVTKSPSIAKSMLSDLSQSIKRNEEAKNGLQQPQDPLNRLKPSPVGTDNGQKTIKDYKSASFLRG